jgi:hypothetical protein
MNLVPNNPQCSPHPVHNPIVQTCSHSPTGNTSYEMAGTSFSSAGEWTEDLPIASTSKSVEKPVPLPSFQPGKVYPSDGGWTTDDCEGHTVNVTGERCAYI